MNATDLITTLVDEGPVHIRDHNRSPRRRDRRWLGVVVAVAAVAGRRRHHGHGRLAESSSDREGECERMERGCAQLHVAAGKYHVAIANAGKMEHEFVAFREKDGGVPLKANGAINEDSPALVNVSDGPDIHPGGSAKPDG